MVARLGKMKMKYRSKRRKMNMRINVYTEEMPSFVEEFNSDKPFVEIITAEYISSRTNEPMKNYGLRIFLKSSTDLHYIPGRDDDRSAVTFWCGPKEKCIFKFLEIVTLLANQATLDIWHNKNEKNA